MAIIIPQTFYYQSLACMYLKLEVRGAGKSREGEEGAVMVDTN